MGQTIGVLATRQVAVGVVEDNALAGPIRVFPEGVDHPDALRTMTGDEIAELIGEQVLISARDRQIGAVGVGFPGVIRNGIVEESPNLQQIKGFSFGAALCGVLGRGGLKAPVLILNDADAIAAGVAATRGHLEKLIRIWYLGDGIGFGRYPQAEGVWEGGHMVVSLDPKEHYCGCGGVGHLEGIMGHRAMRLRFLDMEPEEVFAAAHEGDARCSAFVKHWHRALAAASASSIHLDGPGKFFIMGPNAQYVDLGLIGQYLHEMVKMTPLQGSLFEIISSSHDLAIIGAAVNARRAAAD
ncbi:MAG TPA: ROK family protein [Bryobacteraceae bacterium]|nr:ROK family protein [Bryobacteraceae bacterium]